MSINASVYTYFDTFKCSCAGELVSSLTSFSSNGSAPSAKGPCCSRLAQGPLCRAPVHVVAFWDAEWVRHSGICRCRSNSGNALRSTEPLRKRLGLGLAVVRPRPPRPIQPSQLRIVSDDGGGSSPSSPAAVIHQVRHRRPRMTE